MAKKPPPKNAPIKAPSQFKPRVDKAEEAKPSQTDFTTIPRTKEPHTGLNSGQA